MKKISLRIEIFKEDDVYVALSPELNVSSFGDTIEEARKSVKEAVEAFIDECEKMGTLEEVLEESGFSNGYKISPRLVPVTHIRTNMTTAGMSREYFFELFEKVK